MTNIVEAGQKGEGVRSDCHVTLELGGTGLRLEIKSKVASMYGAALEKSAREIMGYFGIADAALKIVDSGALPYTIAARIETAIRRALPDVQKEYLMPQIEVKEGISKRERFRRSRLYLPGNSPKFFANAALHRPDGIILDLEDSVAPQEKDAARILIRNALRQVDFIDAERMVRINQLPQGLDDLPFVVPHQLHMILIPKCESAEQVRQVSEKVKELAPQQTIYLMPIVESALGIVRAYEIACAAPEVVALTIGLEDYTADIGTQRTKEGRESFFARSQVVNAARAAGVQPIDTVFSDVSDMEGLAASVLEAKSLGFEGKGCIHPRQIEVIHRAFAPQEKELQKAKKIVTAFNAAQQQGLAVVSLGSKMIDPPVVKRALHTVNLAVSLGILPENWDTAE